MRENYYETQFIYLSLLVLINSCSDQRSDNPKEALKVSTELQSNSKLHGTWISHTNNGFTLIEIKDPSNVYYYQFIKRELDSIDISERYFYYKSKASMGFWDTTEADINPDVWISTDKFRFDYKLRGDTLIELDKVGEQGLFLKVSEMNGM